MNYDFNKVSFSPISTNDLSIENANNEQSDFFKMFGNLNKGRKLSEKIYFLKNV